MLPELGIIMFKNSAPFPPSLMFVVIRQEVNAVGAVRGTFEAVFLSDLMFR
jgi:hypothetical protein